MEEEAQLKKQRKAIEKHHARDAKRAIVENRKIERVEKRAFRQAEETSCL